MGTGMPPPMLPWPILPPLPQEGPKEEEEDNTTSYALPAIVTNIGLGLLIAVGVFIAAVLITRLI